MTHFIRQQYFDVDIKGSEKEGFALQNRLSGLYYDQMLPAIGNALDSCSAPGSLLVIDRLDIDAGTVELDRIDQDLTKSVVEALLQRMEKEIAANMSKKKNEHFACFEVTGDITEGSYYQASEDKLWEVFIYFLEKGHLPWSYKLPAGKSLEEVFSELLINDGRLSSQIPVTRITEVLKLPFSAKRLDLQFSVTFKRMLHKRIFGDILKDDVFSPFPTKQVNAWEAFIHFLLNGNLPESFQLPIEKNLEIVLTELLIQDQTSTGHPIPASKIMDVFKSDSAARRTSSQFSVGFNKLLFQKISPDIASELEKLLKVLETFSMAPKEADFVRKLVLEKMLYQSSSGVAVSKEEIAKQVLAELKNNRDLRARAAEVFTHTWPEIKLSDNNIQLQIKHKSKIDLIQLDSKGFEQNQPDEITVAEEKITNEISEGIFIDNAGLVLLHPFLSRFFDTLGISKGEEIVQPERALSLLHYLTTGQTKIPEYELVLPKILCDVPLLTSVQVDYKIAENEISEATALLEAIIKHWEALRDTSPDGLRGTFLLRPGKLGMKEDGDWLLQVESRTFDVLLDYLPWGISMIKLPWMKKMLWVEWEF